MITGTEALEIARARATTKGWAFAAPVEVLERRSWSGRVTRYEIETNADKLGTKARFVIDAESGSVVSEGYISR